ncbi:hypothetical protein Dvina_38140 [Dactylosporangium vinaceum]|uniref:Uncharacterized protein n=1 Tax=Dactylosporangium vinaceum TaxID=53362 RepID=A0ABV5MKX7_9ACTN|nr:hypothetical protein [Dactylosporangium vinaceum]UAB93974.1 hypothetical protein Dvina_38140 [Dactylosporangium vinaceum]
MSDTRHLATEVAATVRRLFGDAPGPMAAYWLAVDGSRSRDDYARELAAELADLPIIPLVIRSERFDDPNAITIELVHILDRNRHACEAVLSAQIHQRFAVILLARRELGISQSSSPVSLPEWVPMLGGTLIDCQIRDLSRRVEIALNARELDLAELSRRLFAVEEALIRRFQWVQGEHPERSADLYGVLGGSRDPGWLDVLAKATKGVKGVTDKDGYRPKVRDRQALVARLWEVAAQRPAMLLSCARGLGRALAIDDVQGAPAWRLSLLSVVNGSTKTADSPDTRFALNAISTIAGACEYLTCAAHTDGHFRYPDVLLRFFVDEMCRSLGDVERFINGLDQTWAPIPVPTEEAIRGIV